MPNPTIGEYRDSTIHGGEAQAFVQHEAQTAHLYDALRPAGTIAETIPRHGTALGTVSGAGTGVLYLTSIPLSSGQVVSNISFCSAAGAASVPLNQWFCLYDQFRQRWAITADDTTTAWGGSTVKTLNIAQTSTTPGGTLASASTFTVPYTGLWYVGYLVVATTVPDMNVAFLNAASLSNIAPIRAGSSSSGLTTPASSPTTATAITAGAAVPWALVK